jgi:hypothetical protein
MISGSVGCGAIGSYERGRAMTACRYPLILVFLILGGMPLGNKRFGSVARAAEETPKDMLAAQIRIQGFTCDKPQRAVRDVKRSKPDHDVWTLKCENATYRVSRYPDLAAKVELLR